MEKSTTAIAIKGSDCYFDDTKIDGLISYEVEQKINQRIFHGEFRNRTGILTHFSVLPLSMVDLQETWSSGDQVESTVSCYMSGQIEIIGK